MRFNLNNHCDSPTMSTKRKTPATNDIPNSKHHSNRKASYVVISSTTKQQCNANMKCMTRIFIVIAFFIGTVIIPYQQRRLFLSFTTQQAHLVNRNDNDPLDHTEDSIKLSDDIIDINNNNNNNERSSTTQHKEGIGSASISANDEESNRMFDMTMQQQVAVTDENGTLTNNFKGIVARPFHAWPNGTYLPCYEPPDNWSSMNVQFKPAQRGFFYLKPYKTGSSTTSGVHLRIARNVANRRRTATFNVSICDSRFDHGPDYFPGYTLYSNRIRNESFLWTIIRDPTKRAISQFFHFEVSRQKKEPTDSTFISFLREKHPMQDYYFRALYPKQKFKNRNNISPINAGNRILRSYDFIGITERLDESFVVLMMILRLKLADILYLSAKTKGGYDDAGGNGNKCTFIWPSFVSPGMEEYLRSKEWYNMTRYDNLLYAAVNRSLDLTIDELGRDLFDSKLQQFRQAQKIANERCLPTTVFPCDSGGTFHNETYTDCIWKDSGCGVTCLDDIATELHLW